MVVIQKLRFMQEFTFVIKECLHSGLHAKLLTHICARAKHAKTYFYSIKKILYAQSRGEISVYDAHIQEQ